VFFFSRLSAPQRIRAILPFLFLAQRRRGTEDFRPGGSMEGMTACSRGTTDPVRDADFQLSEVPAQATERYRVFEHSCRPGASTCAVGRPTACQAKTPRPILA